MIWNLLDVVIGPFPIGPGNMDLEDIEPDPSFWDYWIYIIGITVVLSVIIYFAIRATKRIRNDIEQ